MPQRYELRILADGEVRDADGNLKDSGPFEAVVTVTEEEAVRIVAALHQEETP
jgi:hypothetical protein